MEGKDWIVLLLPILCNGVLLFVFTQLVAAKKRKRQQAQTIHQNLIVEYTEIIEEILRIILLEDKNNKLQSLNEKMPSFFSFSRKNRERLKEYAKDITNIVEIWNEIVATIHFVQDEESEIIKGESEKKISFLVDKLFDVLVEMSQMCINDIYGGGDDIS